LERPILPLGENVHIGEIRINERVIRDYIVYKFFFYTKTKLIEFFFAFFNNLFAEYKILIDTNFPNHKHNFKLYRNLPAYVRGNLTEGPLGSELDYVVFKNDYISNEIELTLYDDKSIFNTDDFTVLTRGGLQKLEDWYVWSSTVVSVFFNPRGSYKLTNQILRNYLYYIIEQELKNNPIKP
jgi:hypothetical protein